MQVAILAQEFIKIMSFPTIELSSCDVATGRGD